MPRHNRVFCQPVLLRLDVTGYPLGKPGSTLKDLRHLDRKCVLGSAHCSFAFPTSLGETEAPGKRCHRSQSQGNQAPVFYHRTALLAGKKPVIFSGVTCASTGERRLCKIKIKKEQGRCYFFIPVSRERASPAELDGAYDEPLSTFAGRTRLSSMETPFSFSPSIHLQEP